eukprot:SAG25_NODE_4295_length_846_cov_1.247657_1_plen_22_part_01
MQTEALDVDAEYERLDHKKQEK